MIGDGQAFRIYAVLAVGYVVSQFYRVSNAVIAPELMRSLSLGPEQMGLVTGVFFLAFGVMQLPTGVLLDRYGPRRTMSALLVLAAVGSAVFALADGLVGLTVGRALIGVGCAAGLMGSMVAISRWFPAARFSALSSLLFTVGGLGILLATSPLAMVAQAIGWRGAFWLMAALTLLIAGLLYVVVRDAPPRRAPAPAPERLLDVCRGFADVLDNRQLWHICAIQFVSYATTLAIAGLWAGPYLNDVYQLDPVTRGNVLLAINVSTLVGVMGYSAVERWVNSRKWTIVCGAVSTVVILVVLAAAPGLPLAVAVGLLIAFGIASAYVMLNHAHARALLPDHLVGRGLTLQNLAVFLGVAVIQSASGFIVGRFSVGGETTGEAAYRAVFAFLALVVVAGLALYLPVRDAHPVE